MSMNVQEVLLERLTQVAYAHISPRMVTELSAEALEGFLKSNLVARLAVTVPGHVERAVEDSEDVPLTWWDHLKERWFPEWAKRRWPVRWRTIATRVKHYRVCPHVELPPQEDAIRWLVGDRLWNGDGLAGERAGGPD